MMDIFELDSLSSSVLNSPMNLDTRLLAVFCEATGVRLAPEHMEEVKRFMREIVGNVDHVSPSGMKEIAELIVEEHPEWTEKNDSFDDDDYRLAFLRMLTKGAALVGKNPSLFPEKGFSMPAAQFQWSIIKDRLSFLKDFDREKEKHKCGIWAVHSFLLEKREDIVENVLEGIVEFTDERLPGPASKKKFLEFIAFLVDEFSREYGFGKKALENIEAFKDLSPEG